MKRIFAACLLLCLTGCPAAPPQGNGRFQSSGWESVGMGHDVTVLYDTETGREYILVDDNNGIALTPRLPPLEEE